MNETLLKLQIGPVQEFIAQARSTRDLWSGSYLLSWLMGHAIKNVVQLYGSESIVFPSVEQQPLLELLREDTPNPKDSARLLTPSLPNMFLARIDGGLEAAQKAAQAAVGTFCVDLAGSEWARVSESCLQALDCGNAQFSESQRKRWRFQIANHWQVTWQVWQMLEGADLEWAFERIPRADRTEPVIPSDGWNENYQLVSYYLDARRHTRDFPRWEQVAGHDKDHFSGREEAIADKPWLAKARASGRDRRWVSFLFHDDDALGAVNLIKRVWHRAHLKDKWRLERATEGFDSVPAVAAAPWRYQLEDLLKSPDEQMIGVHAKFDALGRAVDAAADVLPFDYRRYAETNDPIGWIHRTDASVYHDSEWVTWIRDSNGNKALVEASQDARKKLGELCALPALGYPTKYFAVLALDGDEMGKWLSGEKTGGVVSFDNHSEFSRRLSDFSLNRVLPVVARHHGETIYSGGDDVLVLLSATEALGCARDLAGAFAGMTLSCQHLAASAGIAIAHFHAPLQNVVEAARRLEGRAKKSPAGSGYNRSAFAVGLFKRSGEEIVWGAKWEDHAIELGEQFRFLSETPLPDPLTGKKPKPVLASRFAYALSELLGAAARGLGSCSWGYNARSKDSDWFQREFDHVCARQSNDRRLKEDASARARFEEFRTATKAYWQKCHGRRLEDLLGPFLTNAFICRDSE